MSIEKLALATLSGPLEQYDQAVQLFVLDYEFHPEPCSKYMSSMKSLMPFDLGNPYTELISGLEDVAKKLGVPIQLKSFEEDLISQEQISTHITDMISGLKDVADKLGIPIRRKSYDADFISVEQISAYITDLNESMASLLKEQQRLSLIVTDNQHMINTLRHIHNVDEDLDEFLNMRSVKFRFGRLPRAIYEEAMSDIDRRADTFFIHTSIEPDYVYCMYFALPSAREKVDAYFAALHFERIWINSKIHGKPDDAVELLAEEIDQAQKQREDITLRLEALRDTNEGRILRYLSYLVSLSDAHALKQYAGHTEKNFYLVGWIPLKGADAYAAKVDEIPGFSCVLSDGEDIPNTSPPTKQNLSAFTKLFRPFLEMYGLPDYREIDPSLLMAITYTVLFGVMFGDVGQGAILILAGFIMKKLKDMWIGPIVSCCGVSAVVFGFIYGSVFGYEDILPGFKVLEGQGPIMILLISAAVGVFLILLCMLLNIINGFRQKDIGKSLFSSNGLAGMVFYASVIGGLVCRLGLGISLFSAPYVLGLIVFPLLLMLFNHPLSKLIRREENWFPESFGGFLVEGFFELFETALSFVSNTISFLRVGAFAIIHAGMMMVVFLMANRAGGSYIIVAVLGNLFVTALEALLVSIQLLRIEFYELFSRFYSDGGQKFTPYQSKQAKD